MWDLNAQREGRPIIKLGHFRFSTHESCAVELEDEVNNILITVKMLGYIHMFKEMGTGIQLIVFPDEPQPLYSYNLAYQAPKHRNIISARFKVIGQNNSRPVVDKVYVKPEELPQSAVDFRNWLATH